MMMMMMMISHHCVTLVDLITDFSRLVTNVPAVLQLRLGKH